MESERFKGMSFRDIFSSRRFPLSEAGSYRSIAADSSDDDTPASAKVVQHCTVSPSGGAEQLVQCEQVVLWLLTAEETLVIEALSRVASSRPEAWSRASKNSAWPHGKNGVGFPGYVANGTGGGNSALMPSLFSKARSSSSTLSTKATRWFCLPFGRSRGASDFDATFDKSTRSSEWRDLRSRAGMGPVGGWNAVGGVSAASGAPAAPIVQFSSFVYFCSEGDTCVTLGVQRIGDLSKPTTVAYMTRDGSAKAGRSYVAAEGVLSFEPGQDEAKINIYSIDNDLWDTTTEFVVELTNVGLTGATLGRYLWHARVTVIDNDAFPSNVFKQQIVDRQLHEVNQLFLFWEYCKMNYQDPVVRSRSNLVVLVDQLHNLHFVTGLLLNMILVDFILDDSFVMQGRERCLVLVVLAILVPFASLHALDFYSNRKAGVNGPSRTILQGALLRRFLNYTDACRAELRYGDLLMALLRDIPLLVDDGYENVLKALYCIGQLTMLLTYQFIAPVLFGTPFNPLTAKMNLVFPIVMMAFLWIRQEKTVQVLKEKNTSHDALVNFIDMTMTQYRLIHDYNQWPVFAERFDVLVKEYNAAKTTSEVVLENNEYLAKWLATMVVAFYTLLGGTQVLESMMSLGTFLTSIRMFQQVGVAWGDLYCVIVAIQSVFPVLERITTLINMATDLQSRMAANQQSLELSKTLREDLKAQLGIDKTRPAVDSLPIKLHNLEIKCATWNRTGVASRVTTMKHDGKMDIHQGQLVLFMGPHGGGKSTLLKVVGGNLIVGAQSTGLFFVPAHLRMIYVGANPIFLHGTLLDNLCFGVHPGDPDGSPKRVVAVCRRLGIAEDIVRLIGLEEDLAWSESLSQGQLQQLNLARALIANPEILCIDRPTRQFGDSTSKRILEVLRDFTQSKGLEEDPTRWHLRRPRTCIISSDKRTTVQCCDQIFLVEAGKPLRLVDRNQVSDTMLG